MNATAKQFALFRIFFGSYLILWFAWLLPYAPEIYGAHGLMGPGYLTPFPNILKWLTANVSLRIFFGFCAALSALYAAGFGRRIAAVLLWYAWACLINRLAFLEIPSQGYVGWLLLASAAVPSGEGWGLGKRDASWTFPREIFLAAWLVVALSYSVSGIPKAAAASWRSGDALRLILESPVARTGILRSCALAWPGFLRICSWFALGLELFFAPLSLFDWGRRIVWSAMVVLHLTALALFNITSVTFAMLLVHLFLFDTRWIPERWAKASRI